MIDISIIIPVFNGELWVDRCMRSIEAQSILQMEASIEIVVYNDGSTDDTIYLLDTWAKYFRTLGVIFHVVSSTVSKGVGAAKNGAISKSSGKYLCFQDIDDVMHPDRLLLQWNAAKCSLNLLVGSKISREPIDSTPRLVKWANNLTVDQLKTQIYTSNGPTLLMPTWFCHKSVFDRIGGFDETGKGTPEDLIFFYKHIDLGGDLYRVDEKLVIYTYHEGATTFSITKEKIRQLQLERLEKCVLPLWSHFTVWNAGKQGRKLVRSLSAINMKKVIGFCDVDKNKIGKNIELYCPVKRSVLTSLYVIHFSKAKPPLLICMKLDLTNDDFESNLRSMNLIEGTDYVVCN